MGGFKPDANYQHAVETFQWPDEGTLPQLSISSWELEDVTRRVADQIFNVKVANPTHDWEVKKANHYQGGASYLDTAYCLLQYQDKQRGDTATVGRIEHATAEEKALLCLVREQLSQMHLSNLFDRVELKQLTLLCGIHDVHEFIHGRSQGLLSRLNQLGSSLQGYLGY